MQSDLSHDFGELRKTQTTANFASYQQVYKYLKRLCYLSDPKDCQICCHACRRCLLRLLFLFLFWGVGG